MDRQDDKLCLAQVQDKIDTSKKTSRIESTDFLDMYQLSLVRSYLKKNNITNYFLYGGYEEAERKILVAYSENEEEIVVKKVCEDLLKIVRVELSQEDKGKFTHRNYLGGIVKLGLKREKVGDIVVSPNGADIIVVNDFADILLNELPSLTRFKNSKISIKSINELIKQEIRVEDVKIIIPSLRLDTIVSDLARTSRNKAVQIIKQERVFVNGQNETKVSKQLKLEDVITIRGKGRFIIKEKIGTTRSGRQVVRVEKYV